MNYVIKIVIMLVFCIELREIETIITGECKAFGFSMCTLLAYQETKQEFSSIGLILALILYITNIFHLKTCFIGSVLKDQNILGII